MSEGRFSGLIWFFVTKAATKSVVIPANTAFRRYRGLLNSDRLRDRALPACQTEAAAAARTVSDYSRSSSIGVVPSAWAIS